MSSIKTVYPSYTLENVIKGPVIQGGDALIEEIKKAFADPDDPPVIFAWDLGAIEVFLAKIKAVQGGPPPPLHLTPSPTAVNGVMSGATALMQGILRHLTTLVPGCSILGDDTTVAGLACTLEQFGWLHGQLMLLEAHDPWFAAVMAAGPPMPTPLAKVLIPRHGNDDGLCDGIFTLNTGGSLWH